MEIVLNIVDNLKALFIKNEELSFASVGTTMLIAVICMSTVSLSILNTKATKGYQLNELEAQRQELITDIEISDTLILRAQSMHTIEDSTQYMVKATSEDIYYVVPTSAVAYSN